jgi:hypothetical protein
MPNNYNDIDRYLDGLMSETEKQTFEEALRKDADLRAAVQTQQDLAGFFEAYEPELEEKLEALGAVYFQPPPPRRRRLPLLVVAAVGLLGVGIFVFFNQKNTTPPTITKPAQEQEQKQVQEQKKIPEPEPTNEPLPVAPQKVSPPTKQKAPAPIAAADAFAPNPLLESLISENVRSDAFQFSITSPPPNGTLALKDGKVLLALQGTITQKQDLTMVLYNNNPDAFQKNYPIFKQALTLQPTADNGFLIQSQFNLELPAGIYYMLLLPADKNDILYVANFLVR